MACSHFKARTDLFKRNKFFRRIPHIVQKLPACRTFQWLEKGNGQKVIFILYWPDHLIIWHFLTNLAPVLRSPPYLGCCWWNLGLPVGDVRCTTFCVPDQTNVTVVGRCCPPETRPAAKLLGLLVVLGLGSCLLVSCCWSIIVGLALFF